MSESQLTTDNFRKNLAEGESDITTDRETIRNWVEERHGIPSCVKGTGDEGDVGLLRINFPGGHEKNLQEISWEDFFEKFEEQNLAFLYQETNSSGEKSWFCKFIDRDTNTEKYYDSRRG